MVVIQRWLIVMITAHIHSVKMRTTDRSLHLTGSSGLDGGL